MNLIKKIVAVLIVTAISLSFCACHAKNEIAFKLGGEDYKTSYYLSSVYESGLTAVMQIVNDDTKGKLDTTKEGFYRNKKIEKKKFDAFVKDTALDNIKRVAACKELMKKYDIKLTKGQESQIDSTYTQGSQWGLFGTFFEENGVSEKTYKEYFRDSCLSYFAFDGLYGKDGKKAITDDEIKTYFADNYAIVNTLSTKDYANLDDSKKAEEKAKFEGYVTELSKGTKTFNEIYSGYNNPTEAAPDASTNYDTAINSDDSDYETVKAMAAGEVKLITLDNDQGFKIIVKKDINSNADLLTSKDAEIRQAMKGDEFEKEIEKTAKGYKIVEDEGIKSININKLNFDDMYAAYKAYEEYYSKQASAQQAAY